MCIDLIRFGNAIFVDETPKISNVDFFVPQIMPRAQNAHAMVNAGFLFKLDSSGKMLQRPNIIYGGIRPDFVRL